MKKSSDNTQEKVSPKVGISFKPELLEALDYFAEDYFNSLPELASYKRGK